MAYNNEDEYFDEMLDRSAELLEECKKIGYDEVCGQTAFDFERLNISANKKYAGVEGYLEKLRAYSIDCNAAKTPAEYYGARYCLEAR